MNEQLKKNATVYWLREDEGGRKNIPSVPKLVAPASVDGPQGSVDASWSLVIEMEDQPVMDRTQIVTIHFLVPEAPSHLLVKNAEFIMFDGPRAFLKGQILD
ncbi:hypothetical protein [Gimesia aquarii]|uniref:Uncharacterized protein n=1 Tax=Gimesia aquarii TaxID=2527964 RepID=A0A517VXF2_9PLAN|nr:hypothetical protein [Gimesia aquarii]QDT97679.1 hypothetical protein V144x_31590 [Gimesia aquarii]